MLNREAIKSGIYKIKNLVTNDFYIGSAINLVKRKNNHLCHLRGDKHPNQHLQRAWNKYGETNFEFTIVIYCSVDEVIKKEQFYIDTLNPVYNICRIAGNSAGRIPTKETRLKMSIAQTGRKQSEETKLKVSIAHKGRTMSKKQRLHISKIQCKPICQIDKDGNIINTFNSGIEAVAKTGIISVSVVATGKRKTAGGYKWKYKSEVV